MDDLLSFIKKIASVKGLDFRRCQQDKLKDALEERMNDLNIHSYEAYLTILEKFPAEYNRLFEALGLSSAEFFRDPQIWVTIQYLLESLIRAKQSANDKSIRIWSAGCGTAEEPFSVSILLQEILDKKIDSFNIEIIGTDINEDCIKFTKKPAYAPAQLKNISKPLLVKYFSLKNQLFEPKDPVRKMVEFKLLDLTSDDIIKDIDLIICRNVFLYFDKKIQKILLHKFHRSLRPHGYLLLGKVEISVEEETHAFKEIDSNARIYQRI